MGGNLCGEGFELVGGEGVIGDKDQPVAAKRFGLGGKVFSQQREELAVLGGERLLFLGKLGFELFDVAQGFLRLAGEGGADRFDLLAAVGDKAERRHPAQEADAGAALVSLGVGDL